MSYAHLILIILSILSCILCMTYCYTFLGVMHLLYRYLSLCLQSHDTLPLSVLATCSFLRT